MIVKFGIKTGKSIVMWIDRWNGWEYEAKDIDERNELEQKERIMYYVGVVVGSLWLFAQLFKYQRAHSHKHSFTHTRTQTDTDTNVERHKYI